MSLIVSDQSHLILVISEIQAKKASHHLIVIFFLAPKKVSHLIIMISERTSDGVTDGITRKKRGRGTRGARRSLRRCGEMLAC